MKKTAKKMTLNRDTLGHLNLNAQALTNVAAAASVSCRATVCPIDTPPHTKAECA